jgi:hypothetical protein
LGGKEKSLAYLFQQDVHILAGGYAAEEHNLEIRSRAELRDIAREWRAIRWMIHLDVHCPEVLEILGANGGISGQQPPVGCDDLYPRMALGRPGEAAGVRQFSPEVEAAEKAECFAETHPGRGAKALGQREGGAVVQQDRSALASAVRG